jgi:hypothetical protein
MKFIGIDITNTKIGLKSGDEEDWCREEKDYWRNLFCSYNYIFTYNVLKVILSYIVST